MKITNKHNLPKAIYNAITRNSYEPKPNRYGATTLLLPPQEIVLREKLRDQMTADVSDMLNLLFGTAVHDYLEKYDDGDFVEHYASVDLGNGFTVSGKIDKYDAENFTVIDYKTARVNTIVYDNFDDWKKQGLIYAWLLMQQGHLVTDIKFYALLKDWSQYAYKNAYYRDEFYPPSGVYEYHYKIQPGDLDDIEMYIREKIIQIKKMKHMTVSKILEIPLEGDFAPVIKFAVRKPGSKRALKICDTRKEAEMIAKVHGAEVYEQEEKNFKFDMMCPAIQHAKRVENFEKELDETWESPF